MPMVNETRTVNELVEKEVEELFNNADSEVRLISASDKLIEKMKKLAEMIETLE